MEVRKAKRVVEAVARLRAQQSSHPDGSYVPKAELTFVSMVMTHWMDKKVVPTLLRQDCSQGQMQRVRCYYLNKMHV